MSLSLKAIATQQMMKKKVNIFRQEMSKVINKAIVMKNNLTVTSAKVHELEEKVWSFEEYVARLQKELEDTKVSEVAVPAKFLKDLKVKEYEIIENEANAYV